MVVVVDNIVFGVGCVAIRGTRGPSSVVGRRLASNLSETRAAEQTTAADAADAADDADDADAALQCSSRARADSITVSQTIINKQ